ncbi:hypothetical protein WICPIJ_007161 [Wickerhamomyces pijperi]|uniref:Uncharacterized protein n=1 Tax=Wickerhamomyces pijperi TaxID=599730 RepID=A0A9P8Q293_WICPI|nr:hypothetical protein WICPIJ_007161 [Wickerhamomyces pijperi]
MVFKALVLSSSSLNLTNPKHLEVPVIGSVITLTVLTLLKWDWNNAKRWASVVVGAKSPTNKEYSADCGIVEVKVAPEAQLSLNILLVLAIGVPFKVRASFASSNVSNSTKQYPACPVFNVAAGVPLLALMSFTMTRFPVISHRLTMDSSSLHGSKSPIHRVFGSDVFEVAAVALGGFGTGTANSGAGTETGGIVCMGTIAFRYVPYWFGIPATIGCIGSGGCMFGSI